MNRHLNDSDSITGSDERTPDDAYIDALAARIDALTQDAREQGYYLAVGLHDLPVDLVQAREGSRVVEGSLVIDSAKLGYSFVTALVGALSLYSEPLSEEKE